ncbi:hypothetical protein MRB53_002906 [Persea americana]|uniref:Uncharacterized protein n=1 Tax=Persea americana TaxID=3435 RepID=A0ACC2MW68_PERAE|nr:hypothetical protein MRB53_002906 [Persea americana]
MAKVAARMQQEVWHPFSGLLFLLRVSPDQCVVAHAGFVGALIPKERIKLDPRWAAPSGPTTETKILGREDPDRSLLRGEDNRRLWAIDVSG